MDVSFSSFLFKPVTDRITENNNIFIKNIREKGDRIKLDS